MYAATVSHSTMCRTRVGRTGRAVAAAFDTATDILVGRGVSQVRNIGVSVHRKPGAWPVAVPPRSVECERRHVHHVPFIGNDDAHVFDRVSNLPLHNKPVFGTFRVVMPAVLLIDWGQ